MIVKNYKVKEKHIKKNKRTFYAFSIGAVLCWIITIYRYVAHQNTRFLVITSITATVLAFIYYMWPKRAHLTIDDNDVMDYSDGFIKHYSFNLTKTYSFSFSRKRERLLAMDEHYRRMAMNFIFEDIDDFLKFIYYKKVKATNIDLRYEKEEQEKAEEEERKRRAKIREKKKKEKEKRKNGLFGSEKNEETETKEEPKNKD